MSTSVSDPELPSAETMPAAPSAQADRFVHDRLPPPEQLPRMVYALPELRVPARANLVQHLFEKAFREGRADKPLLRSDKITLTYAEALERVNRIAQVLTEDFGLQPAPQPRAAASPRSATASCTTACHRLSSGRRCATTGPSCNCPTS